MKAWRKTDLYKYRKTMKLYNDTIHNLVYNVDASHFKNNEKTEVALPNNKNEVIEIVEYAIKENKKIVCRAGGTNLVGNCLPSKNTIVIDLSRLNKILDQNSNFITVEPWLTSDELNDILAKYDLYFPIHLWSHATAQIWWMIATNWAWMRAIKYGKMENRVEEIEVLTVDEKKNVKIQNLNGNEAKDFFWSEWTLGIILSAKLKIIKKPESSSLIVKSFDHKENALTFVKSVEKEKNPDLSALEIISPKIAKTIGLDDKYYVIVEYENKIDGEIKDADEIANIRAKRDACYAATVNLWFPQIEDPELNQNEDQLFDRFEKNDIPFYGHIGIGVLHPHFSGEQEYLMDEMYQLVQKLWGNVSGEHGIGKKKQKYLSEEDKEKFDEMKRKWDANQIFGF